MRMASILIGDCAGSEAVEFALAISLWMIFGFVVMYASFALYAAHFVANAADEAARYAIVRGSSWGDTSCSSNSLDCEASSSDVANFIANSLPPGLSAANLTVSTTWPGTTSSGTTCDAVDGNNSPNCLVKVQVSYNFSFPVPFISQSVVPFTSSSQMSILR